MKNMKTRKGKLPEIEEGDKGDLRVDIFNPEDFLGANPKVSILSVEILKRIYDFTKSCENAKSLDDPLGLRTATLKVPATATLAKKIKKRQATVSKAEAPLPSLITEDFDEEQIWEELELQNGFMYENLVTSTSKLLAYKGKPMEQEDSDVLSASEDEDVDIFSDDDPQEEEEEDEDEDSDFFESDEKYRKRALKQKEGGRQYPKSVVDDKFFSLAQMTEHIEQVEAELEKAERKRPGPQDDDEDEEESSDDENIDLFEDVPSEGDEGEEKEKEKSTYFYKDFFDPPNEDEEGESYSKNPNVDDDADDDDDENEKEDDSLADEDEQEVLKSLKSVKFNLEPEEDESGNDNDAKESDAENDVKIKIPEELEDGDGDLRDRINQTLSTFQKRKKKIEENIEEIEQEALQPKSWQLMGEATGDTRPENALLEEHLIYDHLIRPAPEITVETTTKLEDVINQRIKDGAWDDVQRKVRPVEDPREYKKRLVMDAEKSKASLADIYEKEYLEKKQTEEGEAEEKEPEEHIQIRKEMQKLFQKLDTLSHFHFTPKAPTAEVKIVVNTPSISVEETTGVSLSAANMLAPQEIEDHVKGSIKGKGERTATDKKRERRKKKKKQHLKRLREEDRARVKGLGLRNIKLAEGIIKQSAKNKSSAEDGYSTSQQSAKELKSSKAFFAKLQEGATSHINKLSKRKNVPSDLSNRLSAKKFKL